MQALIMALLAEIIVELDYGSQGWTDNFYLNGSSNDGSNVVGAMSSPFSFHSQKIVLFHLLISSWC